MFKDKPKPSKSTYDHSEGRCVFPSDRGTLIDQSNPPYKCGYCNENNYMNALNFHSLSYLDIAPGGFKESISLLSCPRLIRVKEEFDVVDFLHVLTTRIVVGTQPKVY